MDSRVQVILSGEVKPGPQGVQLGTAANGPPGETWLAGQTLHRTTVLPSLLTTFLAYVPAGQAAGTSCKGSTAHNTSVHRSNVNNQHVVVRLADTPNADQLKTPLCSALLDQ
jgi:hypothetical protein